METARRIKFFIISYALSVAQLNFLVITENSCHIIHVQKKLKERFLIKKKSQRSCLVKKKKTDA